METVALPTKTAYEDANTTWTDAVDGEGITYGVGDINVSMPGAYVLKYNYTDQSGNEATRFGGLSGFNSNPESPQTEDAWKFRKIVLWICGWPVPFLRP